MYTSMYAFSTCPSIQHSSRTPLRGLFLTPFLWSAVAVRPSLFTAFHGCVYFVLSHVQFWRSATFFFCPKWTHLVWVCCLWFAVFGKVTARLEVAILTWLKREPGAEGSQLFWWTMNESRDQERFSEWTEVWDGAPCVSLIMDNRLNRW